MNPEGASRYSRSSLRRPVPGEVPVEVLLCGSDVCRARVVDEQGGSLGLLLQEADSGRALRHRGCCMKKTIRLRVPGEGGAFRDVPAELVHVTALGEAAKAGVGFLVSCLNVGDVQHLLALWERFRQPEEGPTPR